MKGNGSSPKHKFKAPIKGAMFCSTKTGPVAYATVSLQPCARVSPLGTRYSFLHRGQWLEPDAELGVSNFAFEEGALELPGVQDLVPLKVPKKKRI